MIFTHLPHSAPTSAHRSSWKFQVLLAHPTPPRPSPPARRAELEGGSPEGSAAAAAALSPLLAKSGGPEAATNSSQLLRIRWAKQHASCTSLLGAEPGIDPSCRHSVFVVLTSPLRAGSVILIVLSPPQSPLKKKARIQGCLHQLVLGGREDTLQSQTWISVGETKVPDTSDPLPRKSQYLYKQRKSKRKVFSQLFSPVLSFYK
nr:PREDICTED: uncharacterized protein LOC109461013 isoform X1 [Rhinolophus sinicus]